MRIFPSIACLGLSMSLWASVALAQEAVAAKASGELPCEAAPVGMACIPGGPSVRGHDTLYKESAPAAKVLISTFYMDTHEVRFSEYMACVKSGKCPDNGAGPRYRGYNDPEQPISGVSWFDAKHYCEVMGKRLPTEAEWEKAARGAEGKLYPWGDAPVTCELAIIEDARGRSCGVKKPGTKPEAGQLFKVGSRPAGVYGLYDMVGNVQEWVLDWYGPDFKSCGEACLGRDPKGPCQGELKCKGYRMRVLKGGSWYWPAEHATGVHRRGNTPNNKPFHHFGFRCAASAAQATALNKAVKSGSSEGETSKTAAPK